MTFAPSRSAAQIEASLLAQPPLAEDPSTEPPFDYKLEVDRMLVFCQVVADIPAAKILETIQRTHSVGAILDPTKYRDRLADGSLDAVAGIARAVLELQKAHAISRAAVAGRAR